MFLKLKVKIGALTVNAKELRAMRREEKKRFIAETNELIEETKGDLPDYQQLTKWKWWHFAVSLVIVAFGIGLSFLVGYLTYNQPKTPGWQGIAWTATIYSSIEIFIWLVLGFIKNQRSVRFYNNRRQRYRPTYQIDEARICVTRRILLLSLSPFLIFTIVTAILL